MPSKNTSPNKLKPYRQNVGIIVFNQNGEVLAGERTNVLGAWQFPQGGIDTGEDPKTAALRELYEEVGISDAELVKESEEWLYYDFPESLKLTSGMAAYRGQMQKWFLVYWNHPATDCDLDIHQREFTQVKFMPFSECVDAVVEFKREVYIRLLEIFTPAIATYLRYCNK
ncbi:NTP pyrophosphohydrolase [Synechococcus sp. PCC 7502]|uniref:RNA pyrophosphohydrolase n=1 Tax=Synechococcus sp. PCC 7502 TaxID=1173263 RepID=UPI00029FDA68|nr:RNA pyrophosphohydrolase [Synechococcus sp. PCC 7502]AFY72233.1 NTP pyrophosphohydrolase [Synechococcus sp. PCC 7502]